MLPHKKQPSLFSTIITTVFFVLTVYRRGYTSGSQGHLERVQRFLQGEAPPHAAVMVRSTTPRKLDCLTIFVFHIIHKLSSFFLLILILSKPILIILWVFQSRSLWVHWFRWFFSCLALAFLNTTYISRVQINFHLLLYYFLCSCRFSIRSLLEILFIYELP